MTSAEYREYYRQIASVYDSLRLDQDDEIRITVQILQEYVHKQNNLILDVGCGTARYSVAFRKRGYRVTGLDISLDQLMNADRSVNLVCASADKLPFADNIISCCTAILVLQQLSKTSRESFFKESYRVLHDHGILFIKTRSHAILRERPIVKFFPSAASINLRRYPDTSEIETTLVSNGFTVKSTCETTSEVTISTSDYITRVKNKHNTTLTLIPAEEFTAGCRLMEEELSGYDTITFPIRHTILIAVK